ncbi:MAG TPA: VWA domain-containing protein [Pyrinomonadaceae bacterium]|nr:VWA domain-containing protein [Pyrinomonadaceae bacterium]
MKGTVMRKRQFVLTFAAALLLAFSLTSLGQTTRQPQKRPVTPAQPAPEPTPPPSSPEGETLKIDTNLVTIPVIVMDRNGLYLPDVQQDEFTVLEDGQKQTIAFFSKVSAPFHVILMLDTSASTEEKLRQIQNAAIEFVGQLQPADRVEVISFDDEVRELNAFTSDRALLRSAILKTHAGQGTKLYDAFGVALDSVRKIPGRKAIVLFTDGVDHYSDRATYEGTLRGLDEEGVIVYPIRYDTRADTERLVQQQADDQGNRLPTITEIRTPPSGTTPPTFPSDDPDSVPTRGARNPGILGLPSPSDILRGRRARETWPRSDPTGPDTPDPPRTKPPDPISLPSGRSGSERRVDESIKGMLDMAYLTGDSYLRALADQSGGRLLRADTLGSLPDALARIAAELRTQYSIGYYPTNPAHDGLFRKVKVSTTRKNVAVRAKPGYRAPTGG